MDSKDGLLLEEDRPFYYSFFDNLEYNERSTYIRGK